jgi:hypothetical protein
MLYVQLVPCSRMAQRFTGSGLKIATDIAGILGSSEKPLQDPAVRSHWRQWRLTTVRRARWSQWRKYLTVVITSSLVPRSARLDSTLSGIRRATSSSRSRRSGPVELRWGRERGTHGARERDLNITSPGPAAGAHPLTALLESTWTTRREAA